MMSAITQFFRLLRIIYILIKHGLDELVLAIDYFRYVRFVFYCFPWNWRRRTRLPRAERIRLALEDLGPIFVKFGQLLSTRRDILPDDIADELAKLQDKVPPFPSDAARVIIESSLKDTIENVFSEFNDTPLASASVAQVHAAKLQTGDEVVVKVLRPGIHKIIQRDIALMRTLAHLVERYYVEGKRLRPKQVVEEFNRVMLDELNLQREAANASQLRRNFEDSSLLYVPQVYWPYVRENVFVMERIYGVPISDIKSLTEHQVDFKTLANRGVEIFFTQVFRDCFFHADMHPGNIFVDVSNPEEPRYIAIDFGIMGTLSPSDQRYLAENFLAFFKRDYRRVAELHVESGWVPKETRIEEFEAAIRTVSEPIFERPLKEISFGKFLLHLFQTARRFSMEVQPQLVLLQKTLLSVEGLGRQLYPDLDLWTTAKPYMEEWAEDRTSPKSILNRMSSALPFWADKLPKLPEMVLQALEQQQQNQAMMVQQELTNTMNQAFKTASKRIACALIAASLIVSGSLVWLNL